MKALACGVNCLHQTHMEVIIATLKNKNSNKWKSLKYNNLFDNLNSKNKLALATRYTKDDLKDISQHLKVPFDENERKDKLVPRLCQVYEGYDRCFYCGNGMK